MVRTADGDEGRGDEAGFGDGRRRRRGSRPKAHELTRSEADERARALRREIAHHEHRCRAGGSPEIPDAVYDALKRELVAVERRHRELSARGSGRRGLDAAAGDGLETVRPEDPVPRLPRGRTGEAAHARARSQDRVGTSVGRVPRRPPPAPDPG